MKIGVPKEIKNHEYRVGLVPSTVAELVRCGHEVFIENEAGRGVGISNEQYIQAGASILNSPKEIFSAATLIIKVKEPLSTETALLTKNHVLFTFLHLLLFIKSKTPVLQINCSRVFNISNQILMYPFL